MHKYLSHCRSPRRHRIITWHLNSELGKGTNLYWEGRLLIDLIGLDATHTMPVKRINSIFHPSWHNSIFYRPAELPRPTRSSMSLVGEWWYMSSKLIISHVRMEQNRVFWFFIQSIKPIMNSLPTHQIIKYLQTDLINRRGFHNRVHLTLKEDRIYDQINLSLSRDRESLFAAI